MFRRINPHNHQLNEADYSDRDVELIKAAMCAQPEQHVPQNIRLNMLAQAKPQAQLAFHMGWANALSTLAFTLAIMIVMWWAVKPGLAMQWSTSLSGVTQYQVYRLETGSSSPVLLGQLSAGDTTFKDPFLLPGQTYTYTVKGVLSNGAVVSSQELTLNSLSVLPGQIAIILASLLLGFSVTRWLTLGTGFAGFKYQA